jgi:general secretion pathway protein F
MSAVESGLLTDEKAPTESVSIFDSLRRSAPEGDKRHGEKDLLKRIGTKELCTLTRQLAILLRAGMPLVPALSALVEQLNNDPLSRILDDVRSLVNSGSTLADALGRFPDVFSPVYINMVAAGEASGTLEDVLLRLAQMLQKRAHLAGVVKSAIAYPVMMIVVAAGVLMFLLSYVVPNITAIFLEMNRELPWPTKLLIQASTFFKTFLLLIAVLVCVVIFAIAAWMRTKEGKFVTDRMKLNLPIFGKLLLKLEIARLSRMLAVQLCSGIPILGALEIVKLVSQNSFIARTLDSVKKEVAKGDDIANAIKRTGSFPPIVFHILATGQISGSVESGLLDIADMYDSEVELTAKTLTSLLEPAILVVTGAIIGFIVLAILLPIFEINQML